MTKLPAHTLTEADIAALLPPRPRDTHKGANGRALLCVGSGRYAGAALLSAAAALRVGCGVLEAAVPREVRHVFAALPEACCTAVGGGETWDEAAVEEAVKRFAGKQALGIGCGMDYVQSPRILEAALACDVPVVIDADGLNLLSRHRDLLNRLSSQAVLTPHPGEMARLTGLSVGEITRAPAAVAAEAARAWRCTVLLKGAVTHIACGERAAMNETGNPGLSKGGSGDVLTGLIVGLLAQGLAPFDAACAGAYLLGLSADAALRLLGNRMLMAGDVIDAVRGTLRCIQNGPGD